ncbi:MAG: ABC transporter substrate-binding protein [Syntrophomonadaceae bacterium]
MAKKHFNHKAIPIILSLMLLVTGIAGCSNTEKASKTESEPEVTTLTVTDMAGREVVVPKEIKKIFSAVPIGTVMLYTINPDLLAAKNFKLSELEKKYTVEAYHSLPVLGTYIMGDTANEEDILKLAPDVIIYAGFIDDSWKAKVDEAQKRLEIPVIMVDGDLKGAPAAYEFLGKLLGEEEKAQKLSKYCQNTLTEAEKIASQISEEKRVRMYYASGEDGLMTYAAGNLHAELIDIVGGKNFAAAKLGSPYQNTRLSAEQLIKWNPEIIVANKVEARGGEGGTASLRARILGNSTLNNLDAVKNGQVYEIPCAPFSWFGQPPSVVRILGIKWLGNLTYPDQFKYDIEKETKEFYKTFYSYDLSDEDFAELTSNALCKQ